MKRLTGAFGRSTPGLEFRALDGEPVHCIFLLLSPQDAPRQHIAALEAISRLLRENAFRKGMLRAKDRDAMVDLIRDAPGRAEVK